MDLLDISKVDMKERLDLINRYYSELDYVEYERYKRNISSIIPTLSHVTQPKGDNFVKRFLMTIQTIYDSNYFFEYMGYHKDIFTIICDVLYYYPSNANWKTLNDISENNDKVSIIWTIMLSLFSMYIKPEMITFLEEMIIKNSSADNDEYKQYKTLLSRQNIEIILFEDADLYAVIYYLKLLHEVKFRNLNKIWIAEPIKQNFLSLVSHYFKKFKCPTCIFQTKQELLTLPTFYKMNITSIWSEDFIAAKNLAASLDRNIIFINTMPFYDAFVVLPYIEVFKVPLPKNIDDLNEDQYIINMIQPIRKTEHIQHIQTSINPIYNFLFYDGAWQKPIKHTYWIQHNVVRANASRDDIIKCVASARKGFNSWSILPSRSRIKILSQLSHVLRYSGIFNLALIVSNWVLFSKWYKSSLSFAKFGFAMSAKVRKPKGIITLMEEDGTVLFDKLIQSLVIGNTVIVICTSNSFNLAPYCDIFSTSGIPPGVINLLSCEDVMPLSDNYTATELKDIYYQFTVSKQIITLL